MTPLDMSQVIRGYIRELYNLEYNKKIDVKNLEPEGYQLSLYLDGSIHPFVLMADLPEQEFLQYVKEELRKRKLQKTKYFKLTKLYDYKPKICNERKGTY